MQKKKPQSHLTLWGNKCKKCPCCALLDSAVLQTFVGGTEPQVAHWQKKTNCQLPNHSIWPTVACVHFYADYTMTNYHRGNFPVVAGQKINNQKQKQTNKQTPVIYWFNFWTHLNMEPYSICSLSKMSTLPLRFKAVSMCTTSMTG